MSLVVILILGVGVVALFLIVLSLMREIVLLRGEVAGLTQVITIPPDPGVIGQRVPQRILSAIVPRPTKGQVVQNSPDHAVIFLSSECGGCDSLVREIDSALTSALIAPVDLTAVVPAPPADHAVEAPLRSHGVTVVVDDDKSLFDECDVRGTPVIIVLDSDSGKATDYSYGGDAKWIMKSIHRAAVPDENS